MGVSGAGKTAFGRALAVASGVPFIDADDLHSAANVEKMSAGIPLNDSERIPWLFAVADRIAVNSGGCVVACSALKRQYRDLLRHAEPGLIFAHLSATADVILHRIDNRSGHFMPRGLLASQFAILELLQPDENGLTLDANTAIDQLVTEFQNRVGRVLQGEIL